MVPGFTTFSTAPFAITIQKPSPLYTGNITLAVTYTGTPPSGSHYFVAWRTSGIPPVSSPEFKPITFNGNGTGSVTVPIDHPGMVSSLYLSNGTTVTLLWSATPLTPFVVTVQQPNPLYTGKNTLAVTYTGVPPSGSHYYLAWRTVGKPSPTSTEFQPITFTGNGTGSATVTIDRPGTPSSLYLSDGTTVTLLWTATPLDGTGNSSSSSGGSTPFVITVLHSLPLYAGPQYFAVTYTGTPDPNKTYSAAWSPVAPALNSSSFTPIMISDNGLATFTLDIDPVGVQSTLYVSDGFTITPQWTDTPQSKSGPGSSNSSGGSGPPPPPPPPPLPIITGVSQPTTLYVGATTFVVSFSAPVTHGSTYYGAWQAFGVPLVTSSAFVPITINADGSGSLTLVIDNPGIASILYTSDGKTVTAHWSAVPLPIPQAKPPTIVVSNPGTVNVATPTTGATVIMNVNATGSLRQVYFALYNKSDVIQTSWQTVGLDSTGSAIFAANFANTGDYVKIIDSVTNTSASLESQPITLVLIPPLVTIEHPSPLVAKEQQLSVNVSGYVATTTILYGGWFVNPIVPVPGDPGFVQMKLQGDTTLSSGFVILDISPAGAAGAVFVTDGVNVWTNWSDTPNVLRGSPGPLPIYTVSSPGTQTEAFLGSGVDVSFAITAPGWPPLYAAIFDSASTQKTAWNLVTIPTNGIASTILHMSNTGDYLQVVDNPDAVTARVASSTVKIIPGPVDLSGAVLTVAHPSPLYPGTQTLAVAIAGIVDAKTKFYAAWASGGTPSIGSVAFVPITYSANEPPTVILTITNPGAMGSVYTTDGNVVREQWHDTPVVVGQSSAGSGQALSLIATSNISPLGFKVYQDGENMVIIGIKNYGKPATLSLQIDSRFGGIIEKRMPDGEWSLTRPMLSDGSHQIAIYVVGDLATSAHADFTLPTVAPPAAPTTPSDIYDQCMNTIENCLAALRSSLNF